MSLLNFPCLTLCLTHLCVGTESFFPHNLTVQVNLHPYHIAFECENSLFQTAEQERDEQKSQMRLYKKISSNKACQWLICNPPASLHLLAATALLAQLTEL